MYADDLLVMSRANEEEARAIKTGLWKYCSWAGQEINTDKSGNLFSKNCPIQIKRKIKDQIGLKEMGQQVIYLGNSLVFGRNMTKEFHHLKDKIKNRLQGWTANLISKARKATLIKSVAQAVPTYAMSSFLLPKNICSDMDGIIRRYWWSANPNATGFMALKSWNEICTPKAMGGLGFRKFHDFNIALISKLSWSLANEDERLWTSILKAKYLRGKSFFEHAIPRNCSKIWRGIVAGRDTIKLNACFFVGDGCGISPFKDPWIPN